METGSIFVNRRYELQKLLSQGAGGLVFAAHDRLMKTEPLSFDAGGGNRVGSRPDPTFVIKIFLDPQRERGARADERIARLVTLRHPHLSPVLDFGRVKTIESLPVATDETAVATHHWHESTEKLRGAVFLTTAYVSGGDLTQATQRFLSKQPPSEALDRWLTGVVSQALEALRYLHELALLHFDIKPEHLLCDALDEFAPGIPKLYLIDLGLSARESTPLGNRVRGTFPYMAPEVLKSSMVDHRVDLYSLGMTLYHALTGGLLVRENKREDLLQMARNDAWPQLSDLVPTVPEYWRATIHRLLSAAPEARHASAAALIEEIRRREAAAGLPKVVPLSWKVPLLVGQEREYEYVGRELDRLGVGEINCSLILLSGEQGVGRRALIERLIGLSRCKGIECFRVRCCGATEAPLAPIEKLLQQLRQHPLTPESMHRELEFVIDWLRNGALPPTSQFPPLPERRHERVRLLALISNLLAALPRGEPFLFVIEELHLGAPELIECLALISHRLRQARRQDVDANSRPVAMHRAKANSRQPFDESVGRNDTPLMDLVGGAAELSVEDDGAYPPSEVASIPTEHRDEPALGPAVLIVASIDDRWHEQPRFKIKGRILSLSELSREPDVARISLKPLSLARTRDLLREALGPCHFPPQVYADLHRGSRGMSRSLLQLVGESLRYGLIRRESHGWVLGDTGFSLDRLRALRTAEWNEFTPTERAVLLALERAQGGISTRSLLAALERTQQANPKVLLQRLESLGWLSTDSVTSLVLLDHSPADAHTGDSTAADRAELARFENERAQLLLEESPQQPYGAVRLLQKLGATALLSGILPRALDGLRSIHAESTIVELVDSLRATAPEVLDPDTLFTEALALLDLDQLALATDRLVALIALNPGGERQPEARLVVSKLFRAEGRSAEARRELELALVETRALANVELEARAWIELGETELAENDTDAAARCAANALELVVGTSTASPRALSADVVLTARVRLFQSFVQREQGLGERAHTQLSAFLDRSREELPGPWLARALDRVAALEYQHGRYDQALRHWGECIALHEKSQDWLFLADALGNLGRVYTNRGEQELATRCYQRCLVYFERVNHRHGIASTRNNMGLVYKMCNRLEEAERCFRSSLELYEALGPPDKFQAVALNNLSDIIMQRGDYQEALKQSLRSLEIRKTLNNPNDIAFSYYRIASIYRTQGEIDLAQDFAEKSLEIRREHGDKMNLGYVLKLLGDLHLLRGQYLEALRCLRQSLATFEALGNKVGRLILLDLLSAPFRQVGLYDEARQYVDKATALARELGVECHIGAAMQSQGLLHLELGELAESETCLKHAEQALRRESNRRDLAALLLDKARLMLELGQRERSESALEEAYQHIEELGSVDLYPYYYRLRGRLEAARGAPDLPVAMKLLERGLEEARKLDLPEEVWRIQHALGRLENSQGRRENARQFFQQAVDALYSIRGRLPSQFQESYLQTSERAEALGDLEALLTTSPDSPNESGVFGNSENAAPIASHSNGGERGSAGIEAEELLKLQEISALIATERNLNTLLERILDAVIELFHAERGFLILSKDGKVVVRSSPHLVLAEDSTAYQPYSRSIAGQVLASGTLFLTTDAQHDERLASSSSVHDLRLQAIACFPLDCQGQRLGVIYLENRHSKQLLPKAKARLLMAFSSQAAVAIRNASLLEENDRRRGELEISKQRIEELNRALEHKLEEQSRELEQAQIAIQRQQGQLEARFQFHNILGACPQMRNVYALLERIAATSLPVLIEGESGTGKELVARALHYCERSERRQRPFISENCAAVAESLFESELFGHVKGAFTGADRDKPGLIALAKDGTLFLDEIHALSLEMQRKLLRVLQEGEYRPVGGGEFFKANVRLLAAANRPLWDLVQEGKFREDLYYRLNVLRLELPPLRDRGNDILLLAKHFLTEICRKERLDAKVLSPESLQRLLQYSFPGNVRELRNIMEKAAVLSVGPTIRAEELYFDTKTAPANSNGGLEPGLVAVDVPLRKAKDSFQQHYLRQLLATTDGVVAHAAAAAGITRESLHRLLKKYGIR
ncbi:MAG: sigma 54-interacting transcriptional regulator [Planctomycetota bacterium]